MLKISNTQLEAFEKKNIVKFRNEFLESMKFTYPEIYATKDDPYWISWCAERIREAEIFYIVRIDETGEYIELCFLHESIHGNKKPEWFIDLMKQVAYPNTQKLNILNEKLQLKD